LTTAGVSDISIIARAILIRKKLIIRIGNGTRFFGSLVI
jgi:hypothetical protein